MYKFKKFIILCDGEEGVVNGAVHFVVEVRKALVTVLSVGINYVSTSLFEYDTQCTVLLNRQGMGFRTLTPRAYNFFYAKGPHQLLWTG